MAIFWLQFIVLSAAILYCGSKLSRYGDIIAEKTGLGRTWIGVILMAVVTSLPELVNGISSVTAAGVPDIAIGDILGSCVFNLSIIVVMDVIEGRGPIFARADTGHDLTAGFCIILIGIAAASIPAGDIMPGIGHIGFYTPLIVLVYLISVRAVFRFESKKMRARAEPVEKLYAGHGTAGVIALYSVNALVIIVAATFLPFVGERIAVDTGLGDTFVGTIFIALSTSLPELVVSIAAVRIGAADLAMGNLLGSNLFNILIIGIDDIFYTKGPLLLDVSRNHVITGVVAMIMTAVAIVGLTYRSKKKTAIGMGWESVALASLFLVNMLSLYILKGGG